MVFEHENFVYEDKKGLMMKAKFICLFIFFPLLFLTYCSSKQSSIRYPDNRFPETAYSVNTSRDSRVNLNLKSEYALGFNDVIEIKFFNNAEFNETIKVRPDGRISMQRVGDIYVNGMTPSQLDTIITRTYAKFLRDPEVTIFVREFGAYQVYVFGEVTKPGGFPLQRNMTILQALATAGGPTKDGKLNSTILIRPAPEGSLAAIKLDLTLPMQGVSLNTDLYVQPNDIIYIPRTYYAKVHDFMVDFWHITYPPIDLFFRYIIWKPVIF
jgi:protein involved in polysaccharide export with SLBB domain